MNTERSDEMAVFRIERTRDYTVMSNHHLRDKALSLKSKGLLSMMLSLPEDWNYTTRGLAKICKEGVDAIGGALRELESAGYIVRHQMRDRQGRISDTEYVMNRLLKNVLFSSVGTASGRYPNSNGMAAFGKTGTASDEKDLWFVGGTPYYVTAVWWGYDAPYDMTKTLGKQQAKTRTCVTAWKALMEQIQADLPYKAFPAADGVVERSYCTQSGLLASGSCPSTAVGYYRADDLPDVCIYSHGQAAVSSAPLTSEPDTTNLDTD